MVVLSSDYIKNHIAHSGIIFQRGVNLYQHGAYACMEADLEKGRFEYEVDGNYGDYTVIIQLNEDGLAHSCDCPFPEPGCKHTVAVLLDVRDHIEGWRRSSPSGKPISTQADKRDIDPYLTEEEIRAQALEDRQNRARQEDFKVTLGDMVKGVHLIETAKKRQYEVTVHDPMETRGHCTCPDFATNGLNTCKHLIHICDLLKNKKHIRERMEKERFPFVDIYWDSASRLPRLYTERSLKSLGKTGSLILEYFDKDGAFLKDDLSEMPRLLGEIRGDKRVRIQETVLNCVDDHLLERQVEELARKEVPPLEMIKAKLYPYQVKGIQYGLYRRATLIGDEMGLGKTLQAIALSVLKREIFGFDKVLVVTLASLKEQWKREIERFTDEKAVIVAGNPLKRRAIYQGNGRLFTITNYEALLRDVTVISRFKPDLVILDEAQRIKNFSTKTAEAVKSIPRKHALVLTGTPLENKLEDVYSIVQFLKPTLLTPLWKFAADHFMLSRHKKGKILGYRNLELLNQKLRSIVIRRRKQEVLSDLPEEVVNNYYLELSAKQAQLHNGYLSALLPLINKKFLTPVDLRRIQELLLRMRMVCNSTYLIDRNTNISPKLEELSGILDELVIQNGRKVVIFSEWTTMTFLIAKRLSEASIPFVELTGKVPVNKRHRLIDEFTHNPECKAFLSTDAGGTGLNLQAADCVINFELPWSPARMNQRIGRVNRIGQKSSCINVVNLIAKDSIEEKILAGIQLKLDLFKGVFEDGGPDMVEFSHEKRTELLNRLRHMLGEEPLIQSPESIPGEEIPEDTVHFLNPKAMAEEEGTVAYDAEEEEAPSPLDAPAGTPAQEKDSEKGHFLTGQPPEKIEQVLNSGMAFLGGLMEMATGQKMTSTDDDARMIRIDRQTGEVTMKFRLPGF
ncbi:MAG: helicase [Desulfococcus sp. 4484_242]|nr:MAG: helicase [Desulfococcus sp. 4484_242]